MSQQYLVSLAGCHVSCSIRTNDQEDVALRIVHAEGHAAAAEIWASLVEWIVNDGHSTGPLSAVVEVDYFDMHDTQPRTFTVTRIVRPIFVAQEVIDQAAAPVPTSKSPAQTEEQPFPIGCSVRSLYSGETGTVVWNGFGFNGRLIVVVDHPGEAGGIRKVYGREEVERK